MANEVYTENIADFGTRERRMMFELMEAWNKQGLPLDFSDDHVRVAMNTNSGFVFLVNDEYQTAMLNDDNLESFYSSPYEGREGFFDELLEEFGDMHREDQQWFRNVAESLDREDELPKAEA